MGGVSQAELFPATREPLRIAGLFAGIGGIELGFHQAGHESRFLCEFDQAAASVLRDRFPESDLVGDVRTLEATGVPDVDVLAGGFPCQDLSQAGQTKGITGAKSGLVSEMFRLMEGMRPGPRWVVIENVPFMLQLQKGRAMKVLTDTLGRLGYTWAYRVVDTRAFGLPQRRQRVIMVASKTDDPRRVLFADEAGDPPERRVDGRTPCGFYWTEGVRGLGWAVDAVPTLKGGSAVGIPSPPAIWMPDGRIVVPDIRDAERLQGFPADWTQPADSGRGKNGPRWRLVGNAVSVPVARWLGERLARPGKPRGRLELLVDGARWPVAAWGRGNQAFVASDISRWPKREPYQRLDGFLQFDPKPLSLRATSGFRHRTRRAKLRFRDDFLEALDAHIEKMQQGEVETMRV